MAKPFATLAPGREVLLYDGQCNFCRAAATQLEHWARSRDLTLLSYRAPGALERFPGLTEERCDRAMQLVLADGRVVEGAQAAVVILSRRWWGGWLKLYYLPGIRQLADLAYQVIARLRYRIAGRSCESGACAVHFTPPRSKA